MYENSASMQRSRLRERDQLDTALNALQTGVLQCSARDSASEMTSRFAGTAPAQYALQCSARDSASEIGPDGYGPIQLFTLQCSARDSASEIRGRHELARRPLNASMQRSRLRERDLGL